jgi:hypothetical protein
MVPVHRILTLTLATFLCVGTARASGGAIGVRVRALPETQFDVSAFFGFSVRPYFGLWKREHRTIFGDLYGQHVVAKSSVTNRSKGSVREATFNVQSLQPRGHEIEVFEEPLVIDVDELAHVLSGTGREYRGAATSGRFAGIFYDQRKTSRSVVVQSGGPIKRIDEIAERNILRRFVPSIFILQRQNDGFASGPFSIKHQISRHEPSAMGLLGGKSGVFRRVACDVQRAFYEYESIDSAADTNSCNQVQQYRLANLPGARICAPRLGAAARGRVVDKLGIRSAYFGLSSHCRMADCY